MKDKKTVAQILGENLKRIRLEKGVFRKDLAAAIGIDESSYGKYERGERNLPADKIYNLAIALNCSVADILGDNPNAESGIIFEYRLQRAIKIAEGVQCKIEVLKSGEVSVTFPNQISVEGNNKISVHYNLGFAPVIFSSAKDFVLVMESVEKSALAENEVFLEKLRKVIFRPKQVLETTINELRNKA